MLPEDDLRIDTCRSVLNVLVSILMCILRIHNIIKRAFVGVYN
jgi:hypothetical protein